MDHMIEQLKEKLEKFKSWIEAPRLYIVEELDTIKNEIDIFAERFLMRASKSKTKSETQITLEHDKINSNRRQMIDEVEAFEKKLLANMPTNELEASLAKKLTLFVKKFEKKLHALEKETMAFLNYVYCMEKASEIEHAIDVAIYEFDCALKHKSSLLFINVFLLKQSLNSHVELNEAASKCATMFHAEKFSIKQSELEMECDENDPDEDEVEYSFPNVFFQLDVSTTFGVLFILDDCVSKEEFV